MKPTPEQEEILDAQGRMVRINARAGSGKTSTLLMLAEQYRHHKILYLVFNRKAVDEARARFPNNVDACTVHSLAYRHESNRWKGMVGGFTVVDLLPAFGKDGHIAATLCHTFLTFFLNSPFERLEDAVDSFLPYLADDKRDLFKKSQYSMIEASRAIATAWNSGVQACPHDFYLKNFHSSGAFDASLHRYTLILVDEAQDLSPIMLHALQRYRRRIFMVGDSHQQIYSFRFAVDAMERLAGVQTYDLTLSFRFGKAIADLASIFIREAKKIGTFHIRGNPRKRSLVSWYEELPEGNGQGRSVILSRTNAALFKNALRLRSRQRPYRFERDVYPLLFETLDVYWLSQGAKHKIKDGFISSFEHIGAFSRYAEDMRNGKFLNMLDIVNEYGREFPGAVYEMAQCMKSADEGECGDGVILSTIHSAKGREYDRVFLDADMADTLEAVWKNGGTALHEEVNVAYVGFTRAAEGLYVPQGMKKLFTPQWQRALGKLCERRTVSGEGEAVRGRHKTERRKTVIQ